MIFFQTNVPEPFKAEESVEDIVEGAPAGLSDAKVIASNQEGSFMRNLCNAVLMSSAVTRILIMGLGQ